MAIIFLVFCSLEAYGLDAEDAKAMQQTKEVMADKAKRDEVIRSSEKAKKVDDFAHSIGGANTDEIYALATQIFEKLVTKYNGDTDQINALLERAKTDPAGFANSEFSSEEIAALKILAQKINPTAPGKTAPTR